MNVSKAIAFAAVLASFSAIPASAMMTNASGVAQTRAATPLVLNADFVQGHEFVAGVAAREPAARAEASAAASQRYFDVDVLITLGALALASGAFVAVGIAGARRRSTGAQVVSPREGWREEVMQALEADLSTFAHDLKVAA